MVTVENMNSIRYIIANVKHRHIIHEFLLEHFRVEEPITSALETTRDQASDFFTDLTMSGLASPVSILAMDGDILVGICLNDIQTVEPDEKYKAQPPTYKHEQPNRICFKYDQMNIYTHLPDARRLFKIDVISVHPQYFKRGIGSNLMRRSLSLATFMSCDTLVTTATALRSQLLFAKHGLQTIESIAYADHRHNGEIVFKYLHDGATHGKLMAITLHREDIPVEITY